MNDFYLGEIRSGEKWNTDDTPTIMKPVFSRIAISPNLVVTKGSIFVQVFVLDVPLPAE